MCGIFGFVGHRQAQAEFEEPAWATPQRELLQACARAAAQRGPDSCGLAWRMPPTDAVTGRESDGFLQASGSFEENLSLLSHAKGASLIVGHSRLATVGNPTDLRDAQPMRARDSAGRTVFVAHNGNVPNHLKVAYEHELPLRTGCDSEVIAALLAGCAAEVITALRGREAWKEEAPFERLKYTLLRLPVASYAILAIVDERLVVAASGLPLYFLQAPEGVYWCSVKFNSGCERFLDHTMGYGEMPTFSAVCPGTPAPKAVW